MRQPLQFLLDKVNKRHLLRIPIRLIKHIPNKQIDNAIAEYSISGVCSLYTCENDGVCRNQDGAPTCECLDGYDGQNCEEGKQKCRNFSCNGYHEQESFKSHILLYEI